MAYIYTVDSGYNVTPRGMILSDVITGDALTGVTIFFKSQKLKIRQNCDLNLQQYVVVSVEVIDTNNI